jgi:hypothetical protein
MLINAGLRPILATFAVILATLATAPVAAADPYDPSTPYQVPTPAGTVLPGNRPLQPHCLDSMLSCGYHFDIDGGRWDD